MPQPLIVRCFCFLVCGVVVALAENLGAAEGTATNRLVEVAWGDISFLPVDAQLAGGAAGVETKLSTKSVSLIHTSDVVSWNYKPTRWGMYEVNISYSAETNGGTMQVEVAGRQFSASYSSTGDTSHFTNLLIGRVYVEKVEPFSLQVRSGDTNSLGALNLAAIILRPAPEGKSVIQQGDGPITLHASNAITHSVTMRYEPNEKKNCLGYWVNPQDWAEWKFTVRQLGTYDVELWQGCGKGQGGSDVDVVVDGERFSLVVEETGHFQNFVPRQIGRVNLSRAGIHSIAVRPRNKHADAVMDVRQILLKPLKTP
ncbi:hypothetical protein [Pedosphaera parvula]|nr:hypothetical protein [Pedosphaera parvula]